MPQGGLLSPDLWDFDISDLPSVVEFGELFAYTDDLALWYEITAANADAVAGNINSDLSQLLLWGANNKTTFEPSKTYSMLVSRRRSHKFSGLDGIRMGGAAITQASQMKLVGFLFDSKLT